MPSKFESELDRLGHADFVELGTYYASGGFFDEACSYFERAVSMRKTSYACSMLARSLRSLGRLDESLKAWDFAKECSSGNQLNHWRNGYAATLLDFDERDRTVEAYGLTRPALFDPDATKYDSAVLRRAVRAMQILYPNDGRLKPELEIAIQRLEGMEGPLEPNWRRPAGRTAEVLVERLSRIRDREDFLDRASTGPAQSGKLAFARGSRTSGPSLRFSTNLVLE